MMLKLLLVILKNIYKIIENDFFDGRRESRSYIKSFNNSWTLWTLVPYNK